VTTDLITRARAGDGEAFRELTEPYRRELQVYCYQMLECRIGQQCPQTGPRRPAAPSAADRRSRITSGSELTRRAYAPGKVRQRMGVG